MSNRGDSILITGGTGYLGQALARRLLDEPAPRHWERVCIYSRGEHAQAKMFEELGENTGLRMFIGDVRDVKRLTWAMRGVQAVIHLAALKRIEVGHYCADEMVKTNVMGAMNVVEAARDAGVAKVVAISTDKAWTGGVSPYGQSKSLAEALFRQANNMMQAPRFAVVRYGNVWKSSGSIVPRWQEMIARGATEVPVTDPDCTRFFILRHEAVTLVLDTLGTMLGGELVIPETLPAYRVADLAEAMGVKMRVTGLPAWERKHEGMRDGLTSDIVRRLTVEELRSYINDETT